MGLPVSAAGCAAGFSGTEERGYSFCLAARQGDLRELGKQMTQALKGRGGGKPGMIQGSVSASGGEIQAFFRQVWKDA